MGLVLPPQLWGLSLPRAGEGGQAQMMVLPGTIIPGLRQQAVWGRPRPAEQPLSKPVQAGDSQPLGVSGFLPTWELLSRLISRQGPIGGVSRSSSVPPVLMRHGDTSKKLLPFYQLDFREDIFNQKSSFLFLPFSLYFLHPEHEPTLLAASLWDQLHLAASISWADSYLQLPGIPGVKINEQE